MAEVEMAGRETPFGAYGPLVLTIKKTEMLKKGPFLSTYNSFLYLYSLPLAPSYTHYIHSYTCRHPESKTGARNTDNSLF